MNKHLLRKSVIYGQKSFITLGPVRRCSLEDAVAVHDVVENFVGGADVEEVGRAKVPC